MDEAFFFGKKGKALMLAKQMGTRELAYAVHSDTNLNRSHASEFLFQNVQPRTRLQTDGGGIYEGIANWWPVLHRVDIHRKFQFGLTSEIEGMFGNLRTFIRRMYHHVTRNQFEDYVREFCARFSSPEMFNSPLSYLEKTIRPVPLTGNTRCRPGLVYTIILSAAQKLSDRDVDCAQERAQPAVKHGINLIGITAFISAANQGKGLRHVV